MKKVVTTTRTVEVCDLCERDANNGFHRDCYVCGKRCCLTCCRAIFVPERRQIDWQLNICCDCEGSSGGRINAMIRWLSDADRLVAGLLDAWRKERRAADKE